MEQQKKKKPDDRKMRKKGRRLTEDCRGNIQQSYFLDGGKGNINKSTGRGQKKIEDDGSEIHLQK